MDFKLSIKELSSFNSDVISDPEDWLNRYELRSRMSNWSDEDKRDYLELFLEGKDLIWYKRNKAEMEDWMTTKTMFLDKFDGQQKEMRAWNDLQKIKQADFDDFGAFEAEFERLLSKAKVSDKGIQLKLFISALRPKYQRIAIKNRVEDYTEAITLIEEEEAVDKVMAKSEEFPRNRKTKPNEIKKVKVHQFENNEMYEALVEKFQELTISLIQKIDQKMGSIESKQNPNEGSSEAPKKG
ncbi:hypothetical protein BB560_005829, partial [Smittium megazygosporum]